MVYIGFYVTVKKIVINSVKKIKLVLRVQVFNSRCDLSGLYRSGDNRTFTTLMSSRLKRKLGDIGIDPSSAKANESFCLVCIKAIFLVELLTLYEQIGTPLPPLEKSKDNGEFVPLWKQDVRYTRWRTFANIDIFFVDQVRDEQGRRRLHGAFTGGFSAGYFNTVGSKEGM